MNEMMYLHILDLKYSLIVDLYSHIVDEVHATRWLTVPHMNVLTVSL